LPFLTSERLFLRHLSPWKRISKRISGDYLPFLTSEGPFICRLFPWKRISKRISGDLLPYLPTLPNCYQNWNISLSEDL
jgi:hypothetical protein